MDFVGIDPQRVTFSWVSASEGGKWAEVVNSTTEQVRRLGPFEKYPGHAPFAGETECKI
jgi:coenzyme F420-reducing hydrogenase delta subunit